MRCVPTEIKLRVRDEEEASLGQASRETFRPVFGPGRTGRLQREGPVVAADEDIGPATDDHGGIGAAPGADVLVAEAEGG